MNFISHAKEVLSRRHPDGSRPEQQAMAFKSVARDNQKRVRDKGRNVPITNRAQAVSVILALCRRKVFQGITNQVVIQTVTGHGSDISHIQLVNITGA